MADGTHIEWTDATWNPITGCSIVSPGCTNCYAMKLAGGRLQHHHSRAGLTTPSKTGPVWNGQVRLIEAEPLKPLQWKRSRRIFVCAHGDLFHESVPDEWIDRVFAVMALSYRHKYQVLTKRSVRMREYIATAGDRVWKRATTNPFFSSHGMQYRGEDWPLTNVWLGVSAEDQARADERIPDLLATPAAVRFLSAEPLLGPIDLTFLRNGAGWSSSQTWDALSGRGNPFLKALALHPGTKLDWVIVGGESGPGARPMHPDWARQIRDDCAAAGVPFFFKQWGAWTPIDHLTGESDDLYRPPPARDPEASRKCRVASLVLHCDGEQFDRNAPGERHGYTPGAYAAGSGAMLMFEVGKKAAGRLLDGKLHDAMPTGGA